MRRPSRWALLALALLELARTAQGKQARCGERLERALDMMQQRAKSSSRRRYDRDEPDMVFRQRLSSAPIDVSITKLVVEVPSTRLSRAGGASSPWPAGPGEGASGGAWARVERCAYEPSSSSVRTRVAFSELSVSGLLQLSAAAAGGPDEAGAHGWRQQGPRPGPAESCKLSLRLRRAGMEFHTSPVARARGQMRIRTESSFLEPGFASVYAYACRPASLQPRDDPELRLNATQPQPRHAAGSSSGKARLLLGQRYPEDGAWDGAPMQDVGADLDDNEEEDHELDGDERANRLGFLGGPHQQQQQQQQQSQASADEELLDSLWRSRGEIAREMEELLLSSASQAVTHFIERQLHPAIKETLMLSMGYTISYG